MAPSTSPISNALTVPMAWLEQNPFGNGFLNAEHLADRFRKHIAENTGYDDGGYRNRHITAQFLGDPNANGSCNGFWQHGHIGGAGQPEKPGKAQMVAGVIR